MRVKESAVAHRPHQSRSTPINVPTARGRVEDSPPRASRGDPPCLEPTLARPSIRRPPRVGALQVRLEGVSAQTPPVLEGGVSPEAHSAKYAGPTPEPTRPVIRRQDAYHLPVISIGLRAARFAVQRPLLAEISPWVRRI